MVHFILFPIIATTPRAPHTSAVNSGEHKRTLKNLTQTAPLKLMQTFQSRGSNLKFDNLMELENLEVKEDKQIRKIEIGNTFFLVFFLISISSIRLSSFLVSSKFSDFIRLPLNHMNQTQSSIQ